MPHKAVAEVSKIGSPLEKRVAVAQKWQSEPTDGLKGGCVFLPFCLLLLGQSKLPRHREADTLEGWAG